MWHLIKSAIPYKSRNIPLLLELFCRYCVVSAIHTVALDDSVVSISSNILNIHFVIKNPCLDISCYNIYSLVIFLASTYFVLLVTHRTLLTPVLTMVFLDFHPAFWCRTVCFANNPGWCFHAPPRTARSGSTTKTKLNISHRIFIPERTCPSPHGDPSAAGLYATQYPLPASKQNNCAQTLSSLKHALVPRSFRHCASNVSNFPGRTRGKLSSSWGALNRQVAVSPLRNNL